MQALRVPFAAGALDGCCFVAALLFLNIGGLESLIMRDQAGCLTVFVLLLGFAMLFGLAVAISSLAFADRPTGDPEPMVRAFSAVHRPRPRSR